MIVSYTSKFLIVLGTILLSLDLIGPARFSEFTILMKKFRNRLEEFDSSLQLFKWNYYYLGIFILIILAVPILYLITGLFFFSDILLIIKKYPIIIASSIIVILLLDLFIKIISKRKIKMGKFIALALYGIAITLPLMIIFIIIKYPLVFIAFVVSYILRGVEKLLIISPRKIFETVGIILVIVGTILN